MWNILGYAYANKGDQAAALQANDQYIAIRPGDPNPVDTRADIFFWFGRDDEALAAYRKVLELKPDFQGFEEYVKLAVVYADQGKYALAEASLQEFAQRTTPLNRLYLPIFQSQTQQMRGDLDGALESYRKAVSATGSRRPGRQRRPDPAIVRGCGRFDGRCRAGARLRPPAETSWRGTARSSLPGSGSRRPGSLRARSAKLCQRASLDFASLHRAPPPQQARLLPTSSVMTGAALWKPSVATPTSEGSKFFSAGPALTCW